MSLVIIGSGPGGYIAALKAAQLGQKVTVIESKSVGGTCLNKGCIPTKALIASTTLLSKIREADAFGIELSGDPAPNLEKMMARKDKIVATQAKGIMSLFKSWGITYLEGRGKLTGKNSVEVTVPDGSTETLDAENIIIATGSRPAAIPSLPIDGEAIISSDEALELSVIPKSILIVGAGVIGCEWAGIFRDLGAEVTVIELMDRALATEDTEISALMAREFKKKKIKLMTGIKIETLEPAGGGVRATLADGKEVQAQKALVSIGRSFNSQGLGLEELGIELDKRGAIKVDTAMLTSANGIYAIGDVTGGMLLAHTASAEGIVAARNICGEDARMDYSCVPSAIFTSPEVGSVGLRDFQAQEQNIPIRTGTFQYRGLGKAHAMGEIAGFMKLISHAESDVLLGAHIMGAHASDIIHEAVLAIKKGFKASDIASTIHAHPTISEGLMEAAENVDGQAIHSLRQ